MTSTLTRRQAGYPGSPADTGVIVAREYLRVSRDKSGEERSQEEQHEENADAATDQGWTLGDPYRDWAAPASTRTRRAATSRRWWPTCGPTGSAHVY